jgi:uncharacterized OB-fold protein
MAGVSTTRTRVPAIDGWFVTNPEPRLLGLRDPATGSVFFPPEPVVSRPPQAAGGELETVELSTSGRLWSYTTNHYAPPEPYVSPDPFVPYTVCAVELAAEKLVVLGQLAEGTDPAALSVGDEMHLVVEVLSADDEHEYLVWRWAPGAGRPSGAAPEGAGAGR